MQGGGVYVSSAGVANFENCNILAGSQSPVAQTAISLSPTKEKDLESGAPATKGPTTTGKTTTYSVELTKTPLGLGLSLTDDVVTEVKPDSQAARGGRIKVGYRG